MVFKAADGVTFFIETVPFYSAAVRPILSVFLASLADLFPEAQWSADALQDHADRFPVLVVIKLR